MHSRSWFWANTFDSDQHLNERKKPTYHGWWRGPWGSSRVSWVGKFEAELEEKLLGLFVPVRPKPLLWLVHLSWGHLVMVRNWQYGKLIICGNGLKIKPWKKLSRTAQQQTEDIAIFYQEAPPGGFWSLLATNRQCGRTFKKNVMCRQQWFLVG